jgi:hypothetical protein
MLPRRQRHPNHKWLSKIRSPLQAKQEHLRPLLRQHRRLQTQLLKPLMRLRSKLKLLPHPHLFRLRQSLNPATEMQLKLRPFKRLI